MKLFTLFAAWVCASFMISCTSNAAQSDEAKGQEPSFQEMQMVGKLGLKPDELPAELKESMLKVQELVFRNLEVDTVANTVRYVATAEDFKKAGIADDVYPEVQKSMEALIEYADTVSNKKEMIRSLYEEVQKWKK